MGDDLFDSSDAVRSGSPLRYAEKVTFTEPLTLEMGGELPEVTVAYETYGRLSPQRDNAVLICHAVTGDSHVASHNAEDDPGWWEIAIGPGKPIDTDKYFVISPNCLGGCRGTTGPNCINPATGKCYGADFPTVTVGDIVEVQRRLVDHLGIDKLLAAVGGSMGGQQVLCWATRYPHHLRAGIPIATSARLNTQALAFDVVGRNAILQDPGFHDGQYYDRDSRPDTGLAIARMIGHITYLSPASMREKFGRDRMSPRDVAVEFEKKFTVGSYLGYQGAKFVERFDANSYLTLSMAMDLFDLGGSLEELAKVLQPCVFRWLVISYTSDWLFPAEESRQLVHALIETNRAVSYCDVTSTVGHDAFLLRDDLDSYGELIRAFLANLRGCAAGDDETAAADEQHARPTSIFCPHMAHRLDYDRILELIDRSASVLDLGCGNGELLARIRARGNQRAMGVEIDERLLIRCVQRGLDVVQSDLNEGLEWFSDKQFDCVVLSQTLQTILDVEGVLAEMLRVGRQCIVSFPNFGYRKLRTMFCEEGKAPEAPGLLRHKWYNTPNIRVLTIRDFEEFCEAKGIRIHRRIALDTEADTEVTQDANLNADMAIFVISA